MSLVSIIPFARWTRLNQLCSHTKHRSQSVESLSSQHFRSNITRVHISLDCGHRQQFPKYQILNEQESRVDVFHRAIGSLFRCNCACCAAVCSRVHQERQSNVFQDGVRENQLSGQCTKSIQFSLTARQGNSSLSSTFARQEKLIHVAQGTRCALSSHGVTSPVSIRIFFDVFQVLAQVVRFPIRYRQEEFQFTRSFQTSQHFLGTCHICKCGQSKFVCQAFCRERQIRSHSDNVLQSPSNGSEQCVELDHTPSYHRAGSSPSVPSKASSLPLRSAAEQCPSIRPRTCLSASV